MVLTLGVASPATAQNDPIYDASGAQYGRGYFGPLPFERIDTVTGNVFLNFTDLVLPGNAGMNLAVVRTYNSITGRWRFGIAGAPLSCVFSAPNFTVDHVAFVSADGGEHQASGAGATVLTQEFWRFTKSTRTLELPNGTVATYGHLVSGVGAYLTELRDPFNNTITLTWQSGTSVLQSVSQNLGFGQVRTVTFAGWADDMPDSMSYAGKTWTYGWQMVGGTPGPIKSLIEAWPPVWEVWHYQYTNDSTGAVKLSLIETPSNGIIDYTWATETFPTTPTTRVAVKTRGQGGNTTPYGLWTFDWANNGATFVIEGPASRARYGLVTINGIPVTSAQSIETLTGTVLQTETLTYASVAGALGPMPVLATAAVVRDGRTFTTTYTYGSADYADYGQPNQVVEAGELSRTTTMSYQHNFSAYIRGRVASVTVTSGGDSRTGSSSYDTSTGFLQSATAQGVTTSYSPNGQGNVASVTDATGRAVSYGYDWGVVGSVSGGGVTTTRVINSDGTVASETTGSHTVTYGYDPAGRVISVGDNTPGRVPATVSYINTGSGRLGAKKVEAGATWVYSYLDGLGRPDHSIDSAGVETRVTHNALGQVTYRSRAFGPGVPEVGDTYLYDALGRNTRVTRGGDGSTVDKEYFGQDVRISESLGGGAWRSTTQKYAGIAPGDERLISITDAASVLWNYGYNGFGQLTQVASQGSGVPVRTWVYNAQGWLASATQPESGVTSYGYDAAGRPTSMTDARGVTVTTSYDSGGRLLTTDAPGSAEDVATTYDSVGRVATASNGTVQSTLTYDIASRVTARSDVIAGRSFTQSFVYDGYDNLIEARYPISDRRVVYEYDGQQRLTAVRTKIGDNGTIETLASNFSYRGDGSLASYQYGNGQMFSTSRDNRNRPAQFVNGPLNVTYAYDHVGNVTSITDSRPSFSSQFGYDLLDRLTSVTGYGARTYAFNAAGDRTSETSAAGTITYNYNGQRQLSSLSGSASGNFTYDATGSLLSDPSGVAYTYSALGAMQASVLGGQTTSYSYAGGGSRSVKTGPDGVPHLFVYGAGGGPIAEYQAVGSTLVGVREYIYLGSTLLAAKTPATVALPPATVSIATPAGNTTLGYGGSVTLTASVNVGSGLTASRVEYYLNGNYIGQATAAPYSLVWAPSPALPAGQQTFIARLILSDGRAVSSAPVSITLQ
ncbi:MAG: Ig-like domain-containing protein [Vicinamibacterales bacterium]